MRFRTRRFYGDTVFSGAHHPLTCALNFFGPDRLPFATDMPYGADGGPGAAGRPGPWRPSAPGDRGTGG